MVRRTLIAILVAGCSNGAVQAVAEPAFERSAAQVTGPRSGVLVLADLNRDGHPDLIVQHLLDRKVAVHLNRGAGDFEDVLVLDHALEPGTIAVGQLNGDGFPDLVIAAKNHSCTSCSGTAKAGSAQLRPRDTRSADPSRVTSRCSGSPI